MRLINSPGVQITEKDLSLRANTPVGTNIVVPGFSPQGPTSEPILITSTSELEQIYGIPNTAAERYFYYSCKEVLNSPGVLTTIRLPYGSGDGTGFSNAYSALFYPMSSVGNNEWKIGAPIQKNLSTVEYKKLQENNFDWSNTSTSTFAASANLSASEAKVAAGFVILNDLQTTINELGEGYYVGFVDNSALLTGSPDYNSILAIQTLTASNSFGTINTDRLDFVLSATQAESIAGVGSVSEALEKVGFVGFEGQAYDDHLSLGVFKIRRSTQDATELTIGANETYLGSFDFNKKQISPTGGILSNAFIEDLINEASPTIKVMINPAISKLHDWTVNSNLPTSRVTVTNQAKALFPIGVYATENFTATNKETGNVVSKLNKALRLIEVVENTTVDVVVDAGLSTIYSMTDVLSSGIFDDEQHIANPNTLEFSWKSVALELINFAQNVRKDCMVILDPPRPLFVTGKDSKVIDSTEKTFTADIYNPLKSFASLNSNYAAMYGNWAKIQDTFSGRRFWAPFSSYAAAVYARTDAVSNPWSAPAGLNRGTVNVLDLAINPNQKQRDRFYEISVNPVVFFSGDGFTVMGQKTLQTKPTAFDRINVRRLFLTLERAVSRTLKYFVFEPNTEFTRTRLKNVISPIFDLAKNTEGLYDYLIVCDERINTPDVIDNNELKVSIYLKPVRTAEFILVDFVATRTGQDFAELL